MRASKTEQLVRECFCQKCYLFQSSFYCGNNTCQLQNIKQVATAARRFVRLERKENDKRIAKLFIKKSDAIIKLPKHFGEFRNIKSKPKGK